MRSSKPTANKSNTGYPNIKRRRILLISVIAVIVLIAIGLFTYQTYYAPFQQAVLSVDGKNVSMNYFLKRARMMGTSNIYVLRQLASELIINQKAEELEIKITSADINTELRENAAAEIAAGTSTSTTITTDETTDTAGTSTAISTSVTTTTSLSDSEFRTWYRQQLDKTGLSDGEYKSVVRTSMQAAAIQKRLNSEIPQNAAQIHLNVILTSSEDDARAAKERIKAGESFADVAKDVSLDSYASEGGDVGWVPTGAFGYENVTFALAIGEVSDPVAVDSTDTDSQYYIFMVSEKDNNRPVDADSLAILQNNAFNNWLSTELSKHSIIVEYDFDNTENQTWLTWQLSSKPSTGSSSGIKVPDVTSITATTTTAEPKVDYTFSLYADAEYKSRITADSIIDWGEIPQNEVSTKIIYLKNLGEASEEPVMVGVMNLYSSFLLAGQQVVLGDTGATGELSMILGVPNTLATGEYEFTIMFSRGTTYSGCCLFIPSKVTVVLGTATTTTTTTTETNVTTTEIPSTTTETITNPTETTTEEGITSTTSVTTSESVTDTETSAAASTPTTAGTSATTTSP